MNDEMSIADYEEFFDNAPPLEGTTMSDVVIQALGLQGIATREGGGDKVRFPAYVKSYDPEAHDGRGDVVFTYDIKQALGFPDFVAAMECWKKQSRTRPLRPDGKPNRPLSAFTVTVVNRG